MRASDPPPVVVNFSHVSSALGGTEEAFRVVEDAQPPEDGDEAGFRAWLARAITSMRDAETTPGVLSSPDDQAGALLQSLLAEHALKEEKVEAGFAGALEAKFDDNDWWGWVRGAGWGWIKQRMGKANRHARLSWPSDTVRLPNRCRLAVFGDWGTALYGSKSISHHISGDPLGFDAVIHLGDVYYAGRDHEEQERLLNVWPWINGACNRACNSNHEMYSGGGPYFERVLPRFQQSSSAFVLETDHWLLIGLDTAYDDADLEDDQVRWVEHVLEDRRGRAVMFFSHHQPFSHLKPGSGRIPGKLTPVLSTGAVQAWYWGHEHLCALYEPHPEWGLFGRCLGHGGYPYFRPSELADRPSTQLANDHTLRRMDAGAGIPAAQILDGPNPFLGDDADRYGPHGYMTIELDNSRLTEMLYAADGTLIWPE